MQLFSIRGSKYGLCYKEDFCFITQETMEDLVLRGTLSVCGRSNLVDLKLEHVVARYIDQAFANAKLAGRSTGHVFNLLGLMKRQRFRLNYWQRFSHAALTDIKAKVRRDSPALFEHYDAWEYLLGCPYFLSSFSYEDGLDVSDAWDAL